MSVQILIGDSRERLRELPDASIHCCVTSPPYFGLRDYGVDGQMGLEESPDKFVAGMVDLFREVRRVLRDDGTLWLNLGDSYASDTKWGGASGGKHVSALHGANGPSRRRTKSGLKPKDLIGIPWMVAFALRADGWYLRGDHPWGKPNGMPESVRDRPTRGHEYFFLLSKSERYWYDGEAVRTAPKASTETRLAQNVEAQSGSVRANGPMKAVTAKSGKQRGHSRPHAGFNERWDAMERAAQMAGGANLRSIWWISPAQFAGGHFAVMPDLAAEICIRASCPKGGTVLDPFFGAGTTGLVADRLQRNCIGIELNPEYAEIARQRITGDGGMFNQVHVA